MNITPLERFKLIVLKPDEFTDNEVGNEFLELRIESAGEIGEVISILRKHRPLLLDRIEADVKAFPKTDRNPTYVEKELQPLGFHFSGEERRNQMICEIRMTYGTLELTFRCCCPAYPSTKALGCPLHHEGRPGESHSVNLAKKIAQ